MSKEQLFDMLQLSFVPRWVISRNARPQSVAEHSYNVAAMAAYLAKVAGIDQQRAMILGMFHDIAEARTGDLPYPVKGLIEHQNAEDNLCPWYREIIDQFDPAEKLVVKLADLLEAVWFLSHSGGPTSWQSAEDIISNHQGRIDTKICYAVRNSVVTVEQAQQLTGTATALIKEFIK